MSNVFSFTGTAGKDAEVRYLQTGQAILSVNVANNIGFGDKQETLWITVNLWGKRAEGNLKDYIKKGTQLFVSGELTENWYDKKDGTKGHQLRLNANIIDLVGKRDHASGTPEPQVQHHAQQYQPPAALYQQQFAAHPPQHSHIVTSTVHPVTGLPYDDSLPF